MHRRRRRRCPLVQSSNRTSVQLSPRPIAQSPNRPIFQSPHRLIFVFSGSAKTLKSHESILGNLDARMRSSVQRNTFGIGVGGIFGCTHGTSKKPTCCGWDFMGPELMLYYSNATRIPPALVLYLGCWVFGWFGDRAFWWLGGSVFGLLDG